MKYRNTTEVLSKNHKDKLIILLRSLFVCFKRKSWKNEKL